MPPGFYCQICIRRPGFGISCSFFGISCSFFGSGKIERKCCAHFRLAFDDHRPLVRSGSILLAIVTICCGYLLLSPKNPLVSVERLLLPGLGTPVATQTSITQVQPGDAQVAARSIVDVRVELKGKPPANVRLFYTTDDKKYVEQPVEMTGHSLIRFA